MDNQIPRLLEQAAVCRYLCMAGMSMEMTVLNFPKPTYAVRLDGRLDHCELGELGNE